MDDVAYPRWPAVHPYILLILVALFWAGNVVLGRESPAPSPPSR
jgi:hypothetical protein